MPPPQLDPKKGMTIFFILLVVNGPPSFKLLDLPLISTKIYLRRVLRNIYMNYYAGPWD